MLIVGAGNSGAEIAVELRRAGHAVVVAGRDVGSVPSWFQSPLSQLLVAPILFRGIFHRLLTESTPPGRKAKASQHGKGTVLIRTLPRHLAEAGVERVGRVRGVEHGRPVLEDGTVLDVTNVVWSTGFHPGFSWVNLPVFGEDGEPRQYRGVVAGAPGLYFVGLHFLYAMSSTMIHGVGRDARYVAERIARAARGGARSSPCLCRLSAPSLGRRLRSGIRSGVTGTDEALEVPERRPRPGLCSR